MATRTATTQANLVTVSLLHTKETKNTYRFDSPEDDCPIPSLYVRKSAFKGGTVPESITVVVS